MRKVEEGYDSKNSEVNKARDQHALEVGKHLLGLRDREKESCATLKLL